MSIPTLKAEEIINGEIVENVQIVRIDDWVFHAQKLRLNDGTTLTVVLKDTHDAGTRITGRVASVEFPYTNSVGPYIDVKQTSISPKPATSSEPKPRRSSRWLFWTAAL